MNQVSYAIRDRIGRESGFVYSSWNQEAAERTTYYVNERRFVGPGKQGLTYQNELIVPIRELKKQFDTNKDIAARRLGALVLTQMTPPYDRLIVSDDTDIEDYQREWNDDETKGEPFVDLVADRRAAIPLPSRVTDSPEALSRQAILRMITRDSNGRGVVGGRPTTMQHAIVDRFETLLDEYHVFVK